MTLGETVSLLSHANDCTTADGPPNAPAWAQILDIGYGQRFIPIFFGDGCPNIGHQHA